MMGLLLRWIDGEVVRYARQWLGTPYVHQASFKGVGCDCLGLVRGVWRDLLGKEPLDLPAYSQDWHEVTGAEPLLDAFSCAFSWQDGPLQDGQVLVFRMRENAMAKHVAILCDVDTKKPNIIHAYSGHGVVEAPLNAGWRRRIVGRFAFPNRRPSWQH